MVVVVVAVAAKVVVAKVAEVLAEGGGRGMAVAGPVQRVESPVEDVAMHR